MITHVRLGRHTRKVTTHSFFFLVAERVNHDLINFFVFSPFCSVSVPRGAPRRQVRADPGGRGHRLGGVHRGGLPEAAAQHAVARRGEWFTDDGKTGKYAGK